MQVYALNVSREVANAGNGAGQETQVPRFPCHPRNVNDRPPKTGALNKTVYNKCVSQAWITRTGFQSALEPTPPTYTLFNFVVPAEALNAADLAYLEQYETLAQELEEEKGTDADTEAE